jgi:hypothetical protein
LEPEEHLFLLITSCAVHGLKEPIEAKARLSLDLDVNHHKPFFIEAAEKIL